MEKTINNKKVIREKSQNQVELNDKDLGLIWYACYGSNTNEKCFVDRYLFKCKNKTYPRKQAQIIIPHELYFAKKSLKWKNKGVAFIDPEYCKTEKTLGRAYLITQDQFDEIRNMEGPIWYDKLLELEKFDCYPVKTFTHSKRYESKAPCMEYLNVIVSGLREAYVDEFNQPKLNSYKYIKMTDLEIKRYLIEKIGIKTNKDIWFDTNNRQFELINLNGSTVEIDGSIAEEIRTLNEKRYITKFCCGGHDSDEEEGIYVSFIRNYNFQILPNGFYEQNNNVGHMKKTNKNDIDYEVALANFKAWVSILPNYEDKSSNLDIVD